MIFNAIIFACIIPAVRSIGVNTKVSRPFQQTLTSKRQPIRGKIGIILANWKILIFAKCPRDQTATRITMICILSQAPIGHNEAWQNTLIIIFWPTHLLSSDMTGWLARIKIQSQTFKISAPIRHTSLCYYGPRKQRALLASCEYHSILKLFVILHVFKFKLIVQ